MHNVMIVYVGLQSNDATHMGAVMSAQVQAAVSQQANVLANAGSVTTFSAGATLIKTRASEFIEQRLSFFRANVDDFLFELAGKTRNEELNYLYLDTISRLRNKRDVLKNTFVANFEKLCQDATPCQTTMTVAITTDSAGIDKLLLSGDDDLEATIAMKNIVEQAQRRYASELSALYAATPITQHACLSSVSPALLCVAWKQATDTLKLTVKAKFIVYKLFSKFVLDDLTTLYHGLLADVGGQIPAHPAEKAMAEKAQPSPAPTRSPAAAAAPAIDTPIEKKLHGRKLPDAIHQFLFTVWSEVLVQVKTQKGTDSPAWTGAMQVIDDLAAVTQFKQTAQNSPRLLEVIPRLLCNLQNGLSMVTYEKQMKEQLFNQLLTMHARAIQSRKTQPV